MRSTFLILVLLVTAGTAEARGRGKIRLITKPSAPVCANGTCTLSR